MDKPFFSVIIPAHNSAAYIRKGLDSIKAQVFKDFELIIVCDACTDDTEKVAREYADKVIVTEFGCDGPARSAGMDVAEGEWLLFMDDDDWWIHQYAFYYIHEVASRTDADILPFCFLWPGDKQGRYYWDHRRGMNIAPWSKAYRRDFVGDVRFPNVPFTSDVPFIQALIAKEPKIFIIDKLMYYYNYMREGSQTEQHEKGGAADG